MRYKLCNGKDNTIKQLFDRFYVIPKEQKNHSFSNDEKEWLKKYSVNPIAPEVKEGKNGYIVFRGTKKKVLTEKQIQEIKESNLSQRKLAKFYKVSPATIHRVKKDKY